MTVADFAASLVLVAMDSGESFLPGESNHDGGGVGFYEREEREKLKKKKKTYGALCCSCSTNNAE